LEIVEIFCQDQDQDYITGIGWWWPWHTQRWSRVLPVSSTLPQSINQSINRKNNH